MFADKLLSFVFQAEGEYIHLHSLGISDVFKWVGLRNMQIKEKGRKGRERKRRSKSEVNSEDLSEGRRTEGLERLGRKVKQWLGIQRMRWSSQMKKAGVIGQEEL